MITTKIDDGTLEITSRKQGIENDPLPCHKGQEQVASVAVATMVEDPSPENHIIIDSSSEEEYYEEGISNEIDTQEQKRSRGTNESDDLMYHHQTDSRMGAS